MACDDLSGQNWGASTVYGKGGSVGINNANVEIARSVLLCDSETYKTAILDYLENPAHRTGDNNFIFSPEIINIPFCETIAKNIDYPGYDFTFPDAPDTVTIDPAPKAPTINEIKYNEVSNPNEYDGFVYSPIFPSSPPSNNVEDPEDWDDSISVEMPAELVVGELFSPNILPINIPEIPALQISDFTGISPNADDIRNATAVFDFKEIQYSSDVLSDVDVLVQQMLAGGVGIPESIWNNIYERAGVQIDQSITQQVNTINNEWASRGFSLPQGVQVSQIAQARQEGTNKKAEFARDNAIAYSQEEIKNLQFAVQQGISFETLRGGWHEQEMQRSFEVAKYIVDSEIQLINSDIAVVNAKTEIFSVQAQVYKTLIEAEIAKYEEQRLLIQTQDLVLKTNDNTIKEYQANIQGLQLTIEEYNSKVKAANVESDLVRTRVQIYSENIKAFVAKIQAETDKMNLYKTTVDAEGIKMNAYEIAAKIYGIDIQSYSVKVGASKTKVDAETAVEQLKLTEFDSKIKGYASEAGAKSDILKSEVAAIDSFIKAENSKAQDLYRKTETDLTMDEHKIQKLSEQVKVGIANAAASARAAESTTKVLLDTNRSMAEVSSGLAGSIYSAINISSSEAINVRGSLSQNTNYEGGKV